MYCNRLRNNTLKYGLIKRLIKPLNMARRPLETDGTKGLEDEKKNSSTQVKKERREEKHRK